MTFAQKRLNVIIAEFIGWKFCPPSQYEAPHSLNYKIEASSCWSRPGNEVWQLEQIPNYIDGEESLYNCREMEKVFVDDTNALQLNYYENWLAHFCNLQNVIKQRKPILHAFSWHASALVRAISFALAFDLITQDDIKELLTNP